MSSVTFPTAIGGDGSTVTDDDNATTGLRNGGWRTRFIPCFTNLVNIADYVVTYTASTTAFATPPPMGSTTPNTGAFTRVTVTGSTAPANGIYLPGTNILGFATNSSERVRIDASGNVGIGTSSPLNISGYQTLTLNGTTGGLLTLYSNGVRNATFYTDGTQSIIGTNNSTPLAFLTNGTERMRLDSSGNLLVGTTTASLTPTSGAAVYNNGNGFAIGVGHPTGSPSGQGYAGFAYNGTIIGSITQNGTTGVLYNTSSDQRLKENIIDAPGALSSINAIKIRSFDWKVDGSHVDYGYIAQELLEVAPEAVSVPADAEEMMGVDFGKLTPRLVKAIQEIAARLEALENK